MDNRTKGSQTPRIAPMLIAVAIAAKAMHTLMYSNGATVRVNRKEFRSARKKSKGGGHGVGMTTFYCTQFKPAFPGFNETTNYSRTEHRKRYRNRKRRGIK